MNKFSLALAALIASSGAALALDFSTTLAYPTAQQGAVVQHAQPTARPKLDYSSTQSISRPAKAKPVEKAARNGGTHKTVKTHILPTAN